MNLFNRLFSGSQQKQGTQLQLMEKYSAEIKKKRNIMIELNQQAANLTKKDIAAWRRSWQAAIDYAQPNRCSLLDIYVDVMMDMHLSGCIDQRKSNTLQRPYILINEGGEENEDARKTFESRWFLSFCDLSLDADYYGHSLIQFNDILTVNGAKKFSGVELIPRKHVVPEYGVIVSNAGDDWRNGTSYREGDLAAWCIEVGNPRDLGLLLKCAPHSLSKKNMLAYWDTFGELFGMPVRIGKTLSQDTKDILKIEKMLADMGAASWGLFPEGTDIEIKETSRGDAFNVYDKRIDRANSEISKGILLQTMTIDSGSSLSQSETHLEMFNKACRADALKLKHLINDKLIPLMIRHGFPLQGVSFDWDDAVSYTPEQQLAIEEMISNHYEIDQQYFIDKYKISITGKKQAVPTDFFA